MTEQDKQFLRSSANLCNQRNQLLAQLEALRTKRNRLAKNIVNYPEREARRAGEEAVRNRHIQIIHWFWAIVAFMIPVVICAAYYKIAEIENEYFLLIGEGAGFITFFLALFYVRKRDLKKVRRRAEEAYMLNHRRVNQEYQSQCDALHLQIYQLSQQLYSLERKMKDPKCCCIPQNQWHNATQLYRLVGSRKADSLEEAIRLQNQIDAQEADYQRQRAAQEAAHWNKIQDMIRQQEEAIAADKTKFLDDIEKMAIVGMLLSD